eukprot:CAMPEP_0179440154 /NCGR_PEP_ID=MMETSP0799-20121207/23742_1 /TAXON_ID=46947 /ORGANISM="Geminigera cryophila, Strain CCMP2564" /LENGTH=142 /DNA_ID=CAMNT_0021223197 /DNA_START=178 /DNA_END=606 /DNA_ORIENTATION=+
MGSDNKGDYLSKASLPLQILIFFNGVWLAIFWAVCLGVFIWKGIELPYPGGRLAGEVILLFAHALVESCRLLIGSKGNKTEHKVLVILFIVLSIPSALVNIFYIEFQTYVLRLDLILNTVCLLFIGLEILVGIFAIVRFSQA